MHKHQSFTSCSAVSMCPTIALAFALFAPLSNTQADVYQDFAVTAISITPVGNGLVDVDVTIDVVPGDDPPTMPLVLRLMDQNSVLLGELDVEFPAETMKQCCFTVDDCPTAENIVPSCGHSCPDAPPSYQCTFRRKGKFASVLSPPGTQFTAILDPNIVHSESIPTAPGNNQLSSAPVFDVYHDVGITALSVVPTGPTLYQISFDIAFNGPQPSPNYGSIPLRLFDSQGKLADVSLGIDNEMSTTQCCEPGLESTTPCDNPIGWICNCNPNAVCLGNPEAEPPADKRCDCMSTGTGDEMALTPGDTITAVVNPDGLLLETAPGAGGNNEISAIVPTGSAFAPAVAPPPHDRRKNRYISFAPNNPGQLVAFRVNKLTTPTGSCWVQAPVAAGAAIHTAKCDPTPVFRVWNEPVIEVGDCEIIPVADYAVEATMDGVQFSPSLIVGTILLPALNSKQWGDTVGTIVGSEWTPPNRFTNVQDVLALLAFVSGAVIKPQFTAANLQATSSADSCLNTFVNVGDVLICTQAIGGGSYGPPSTGKIVDPVMCPLCP